MWASTARFRSYSESDTAVDRGGGSSCLIGASCSEKDNMCSKLLCTFSLFTEDNLIVEVNSVYFYDLLIAQLFSVSEAVRSV